MISRETIALLKEYQQLLLKWNKTINLISKRDVEFIWERHIMDCVQMMDYLSLDQKIIDIGSGAGLPGIILSLAGVQQILLVESDTKKSVFLQEAARLSKNEIIIINERLENLSTLPDATIVCRAFSSLENIFSYTHHLCRNKNYLLLKGKTYEQEIIEAQKHWLFNYVIYDSLSSQEGKLLLINDLQLKQQ